ncbi:MAG TPA: aminomethyl-transferring glycine dehydrogenase subunit GcvPA [Candidatus Bathyarchaeota archaeon]|nr:aminomethyl-transferring glycine dehydrogenase subunit GcvPA [Candidatus Bathyarchaeota archaeon]
MPHRYIPNSVAEIKEKMMEEMGIKSIEDLYADIPAEVRFEGKLRIPGPYTEQEVRRRVEALLGRNHRFRCPPFLGGGVWPHYVPAVVDEIVSRAEFLTSYTPYQPEITQGMLQALFEYQSLICELTGMEVANSSMYDWATALGEAARMAGRLTRRSTILVPYLMSPNRLAVLRAYTEPVDMKVVQVDYDEATGLLDLEDLKEKLGDDTAAVYVENPSYLGFVEEGVDAIAEAAHDIGALFIVGVDPISLGLLRPPGDYGADIVIGEGQPLGNHMSFGGPLLGIFACRGEPRMIRQMPGRIIGMTTTLDGSERGFVMTLQTREQHIRRERATSNICTNQALCAVAAAVYLSLLGPNGLRELAELITSRAHYAMRRIGELTGVRAPIFSSYHFKEFTVSFEEKSVEEVHRGLLERGIHGGKSLVGEFPELGETALYCVTELHAKEDIDLLVSALEEVLG